MTDELYDRPLASEKESNAKWSRQGYFVPVEQDVSLGRFDKPASTLQSDKHDRIIDILHQDLDDRQNELDKIFNKERRARRLYERKLALDKGATPVDDSDKALIAINVKKLAEDKEKFANRRLKAALNLKKAQDAITHAKPVEKIDKRVKNISVFLDGSTYTMIWSAVPDYTAKEGIFPDKEPTPYLYCKLKYSS